MPTPPPIRQIVETALYVREPARSRKFYEGVLGLQCVSQTGDRDVFFATPQNMLLLFRPHEGTGTADGLPHHGASGCQHIAIEIEPADYKPWKDWLVQHSVAILQEVEWPHGRGRSMYFHDPDGHVLELITRGSWAALQ